ncbi:MAG TPA: hypothetical protein VGI19_00225 [Candidatus Cybelea sp.]|jgi:hypothetical protein
MASNRVLCANPKNMVAAGSYAVNEGTLSLCNRSKTTFIEADGKSTTARR